MNIKLFFINYAYNIQIMSKSRFELWSRNIARKDEMIDMLIEAYQSTSCHTPFFLVETCSNTSKVFHYPSSFNLIETPFLNICNLIFCGISKGLIKHHSIPSYEYIFIWLCSLVLDFSLLVFIWNIWQVYVLLI